MIPLISINTLSLEPAPFVSHVEAVARLGAPAISPDLQDFALCPRRAAVRAVRDAGLEVAVLTHRAFGFSNPADTAEQRKRLNRTVDLAHALGARAVCMTTGGRGELTWDEAAARFAEAIAPCAEHARAAGVELGVEPTSHLYADASIVHRLADAVAVAKAAGISVGLDLFPCWTDADIETAIAAAGPICAFVQVSDYVYGDRGLPCRAVPGDGAVPLERLTSLILATGCRGPFDIEVIGPRLVAEGREAGLKRAIRWLEAAIRNGPPA